MGDTTNDRIYIRQATTADNVLLAELGARTFQDAFGAYNTSENMKDYLSASFNPEKQAAELVEPLSVFLIAEAHGAAVGYARLKQNVPPSAITGLRPIELDRIYVRKDWIGRRVGTTLMKTCLKEAEMRACDTIWIGVWEDNKRARRFYRKWGFVEVGTQIFKLGDDLQNDLLMQRYVSSLHSSR
jgi:ribosomal protein S18 acetylase RimI-like enzyme